MSAVEKRAKNDRQLRLLLPAEWVADLDSIAASKFVSRLALIRQYLRECADRDLQSLKAQFEMLEQFKSVRTKINERANSIRKSCSNDEW